MNAVPESPGATSTERRRKPSPLTGTIGESRLLTELTTDFEYSVTRPDSGLKVAATEYQQPG